MKRHPDFFDIVDTLDCWGQKQYYFETLEYKYMKVEQYGITPIPTFYLLEFHKQEPISYVKGFHDYSFTHSLNENSIVLEYAKGFIQGYKDELKPTIFDQPQYVRNVFNMALKPMLNVFINIDKSNNGFDIGVNEGKRYKAWEIIFEQQLLFNALFWDLKIQAVFYNLEKTINSNIRAKINGVDGIDILKKTMLHSFIDTWNKTWDKPTIISIIEKELQDRRGLNELNPSHKRAEFEECYVIIDKWLTEKKKALKPQQETGDKSNGNPKAIVTTIDGNKWNTDEIYKQFNGFLFECSENVFNDWFVTGCWNGTPPKIKDKMFRQLYSLIQQIVINPDKAKMKYFKTVFDKEYNSNEVQKTEFDLQYKTKLGLCRK